MKDPTTTQTIRVHLQQMLESVYLLQTQHAQLTISGEASDSMKEQAQAALENFYLAYAHLWNLVLGDSESLPLLWHSRASSRSLPAPAQEGGETDPLMEVLPRSVEAETALIVTWQCISCGRTNQWVDSDRTRIIQCECGLTYQIEGWIGYCVNPIPVLHMKTP